jgi:hypothetical protein
LPGGKFSDYPNKEKLRAKYLENIWGLFRNNGNKTFGYMKNIFITIGLFIDLVMRMFHLKK